VNDVFNAAFTAENPEIMGISICFVREEEKEDENNAV